MKLFNLFNKQPELPEQDNFSEENTIETVLRKAATEPAYRADFYKHLLEEDLIILTDKARLPAGVHMLQEDTSINILKFNDGRIPVFTSTSKIFDKGIIKEEVPFLQIKGEDLFNMAKDATFILNPYSDYGKELLPHEIESLLKGTILTDNHKQITVEQDTQVQLGQPANYPTEIVRSLQKLFKERPTVKAAYLGWIFNPTSGEPPHLIFALDIEGETQSITNEAGYTAEQLSKPNTLIDFIQIDDKGGLCDYFVKDTKPFYVR